MFEKLQKTSVILKREKNYFKFSFKKATKLRKLYLLTKIRKCLSNVPGRPVISNCGIPTKKLPEFLDHQLPPLMNQGNSRTLKDTVDFLEKVRPIGEIPQGAILVTAEVVGLYPSIPHEKYLQVLRKQDDKFIDKTVPTEDIIKMA